MLEGGNLRWDRAQHCLTEGSLRSPVPVLANFRPLTASSPPKQHRGGRTLRCAWGPIYVLADGSDLLNGWIHLFFRNLLFLLENRHTLLTFLPYTIT